MDDSVLVGFLKGSGNLNGLTTGDFNDADAAPSGGGGDSGDGVISHRAAGP